MIGIQTTVETIQEAKNLAAKVVEARLAACVQIEPAILSVYPWEGKVEQAEEIRLTLKTFHSRKVALIDWLLEHHPYEVPEILIQKLKSGNPAYRDWAKEWVEKNEKRLERRQN